MAFNDQHGVKPVDRSGELGRCWPLASIVPRFKLAGVGPTRRGIKFIEIDSADIASKFLIMLFMDNRLSAEEVAEWKEFNAALDKFAYVQFIIKSWVNLLERECLSVEPGFKVIVYFVQI
jgi:hypothetical protein